MYLKPWRRARRAGARGVMPSHQTLLNMPCHANQWLLDGLLRKEMAWCENARLFLSHNLYINDHFTKTGSGQT